MGNFSKQVAIITGAASGLGLVIAHKLLNEGVHAGLLDINESMLRDEFAEYKDHSEIVGLDVTNEDEVRNAVYKVIDRFGKVDILVNCVGITGMTNLRSHEVSSENLQLVFNVNFMSCFYTSKMVLPYMLANNYGRILHISSIAGKEGNAGMLAYSASKAAIIGMTKVQGKEYAESGITVNALAPAVIQTPLVDAMPEIQVKYMTDKIPMKRCGTLEEVANMAAFIVSKESSFTTGFTFDLSGGRATY
ncbi:SDR family NAD(P)-dependent oxidoreductase [Dyadobacter sediminis]|uniref:SDR family oxidoreductase n=1 Tax=Dyadobacter sediminis TaxID=1493691 RepID=A0A5R9K7H0_9BACT|nr:SDR family NAD(P)-dependent oxidoreductase [Dyadobacter sediminis]TLU89822.1 SDR family oxidoreductase [Dyadobacter sediminis]GGC12521.1 3-oxoacyl-ACP reductase [Dyadobacter sediminis]